MPIISANVAKETRINTDEAGHYNDLSKEFAGHETVNHRSKNMFATPTFDGSPMVALHNHHQYR